MIKQHPILFSTPMVQAILAGRKMQTRRVVDPQPIDNKEVDGNFYAGNYKNYVKIDGHPNWQKLFAYEVCKYSVGDVLWVRETFRKYYHVDEDGFTKFDDERIDFAADNPEPLNMLDGDGFQMYNKNGTEKFIPYTPCIFMKKNVSRIWLEVTDVRVEKLQQITEEDAMAEGVERYKDGYKAYGWVPDRIGVVDRICEKAQRSFWYLWKSINGEDSWNNNPWVWVISFKVLSTTGKPENL